MINNNIFFHATKELTTDAFLIWLFYFLDSTPELEDSKQLVFDSLILRPEDKGRLISDICIDRQKSGPNGRIDFMVTFTFNDSCEKQSVLFEDKTLTTTTNKQLTGYKTDYPSCYRYIYCKLGYINTAEDRQVTSCGYDIISSRLLADTLSRISDKHVIIRDYLEYIKETYADYIDSFETRLFINKDFDILWDGQAQLFLADKLFETLPDSLKEIMYIYNGTSSGRPWTQICVVEETPIMDGYNESIFWRIDIRSGKFYIRLNQYGAYKDHDGSIYKEKSKRLSHLRVIADQLLAKGYHLKKGKPTEKGSFEQEIVIFFLPDNDWPTIIEEFSRFTEEFREEYQKTLCV